MGHLMKTALIAAAAAAALSACSGHSSVVLDHPAATATATRGATSEVSVTAANGIDVQALWATTLTACPNAAKPPTGTPGDPYGLGIAGAWPTEAQVQDILDALHPSGDATFTRDRLVELRVALVDTREELNQLAASVGAQLSNPDTPGRSAAILKDNRVSVADIGSSWQTAQRFITGEIDSGQKEQADPNTAHIMRQVDDLRETSCTG